MTPPLWNYLTLLAWESHRHSATHNTCNITSGKNRDPQHDFSGGGAALDTNDNGVAGETFYMKLPAYDGDYLASTEGGEVAECPECVSTRWRRIG